MKGYKGLRIGEGGILYCWPGKNKFIFRVGETYSVDGEIEYCQNGFHFCKYLHEVFEYYPLSSSNAFAEVEVKEENIKKNRNIKGKLVCSEITIKKILTEEQIKKILKIEGKKFKHLNIGISKEEFSYKSCNVVNGFWVNKGRNILDCYNIFKSDNIMYSENISNSTNVEQSYSVLVSHNVNKSLFIYNGDNINRSSVIKSSEEVFCSDFIIHSSYINRSYFINNSNFILDSAFLFDCSNMRNSLFCSGMKNKEGYFFNKKINPKKLENIMYNVNSLIEDYRATVKRVLSKRYEHHKFDFEFFYGREFLDLFYMIPHRILTYLKDINDIEGFNLRDDNNIGRKNLAMLKNMKYII